jgi:hypothetical protein
MMRKFLGRSVLVATVLALSLGLTTVASAFTYEQIGGFTFGTESTTNGAGKGVAFFNLVGTPAGTWGTLGWGNLTGASFTTSTDPFTQSGSPIGDRRSAIRLDTFSGIINPGDTVPIAMLTHANRRILIPFLTNVTIDTRLRLLDGITLAFEDTQSVPISLTETANTATEAECDPSTHIPATTPCSDFFLFALDTFGPLAFSYAGNDYLLFFDLIPGGGTLFDVVAAECDSANPGLDTCGRIRTAEADTNDITIVMTLEQLTRTTPAPATLILLGMALAGAGLVSRLRARRQP